MNRSPCQNGRTRTSPYCGQDNAHLSPARTGVPRPRPAQERSPPRWMEGSLISASARKPAWTFIRRERSSIERHTDSLRYRHSTSNSFAPFDRPRAELPAAQRVHDPKQRRTRAHSLVKKRRSTFRSALFTTNTLDLLETQLPSWDSCHGVSYSSTAPLRY
jgi:hypothetical protein